MCVLIRSIDANPRGIESFNGFTFRQEFLIPDFMHTWLLDQFKEQTTDDEDRHRQDE